MIALDTNILVRYLTEDDPEQYQAAISLLSQPGETFFVPDIVWVEINWVLGSCYDWSRIEITGAFEKLLRIHNLETEDEGRLRKALHALNEGTDFADAMIVGVGGSHGCQSLASFDKAMANRYPGYVFTPEF